MTLPAVREPGHWLVMYEQNNNKHACIALDYLDQFWKSTHRGQKCQNKKTKAFTCRVITVDKNKNTKFNPRRANQLCSHSAPLVGGKQHDTLISGPLVCLWNTVLNLQVGGVLWMEACLPGPLIASKLCFAGTNTYFSSPGNRTPPTKQKVSNSGFMGFNTNQSFPAVLSQLHPERQRKQQATDHHAQPVSRPSPFQAAHQGCSVLGP